MSRLDFMRGHEEKGNEGPLLTACMVVIGV